MSQEFNGRIRLRVSSSLYEEVAKEALEKGTSISGILAQALIVRRVLRNIDSWKSISEAQSANGSIAETEVERVIAKAVKRVRKKMRG
jgi:hypothetical protein